MADVFFRISRRATYLIVQAIKCKNAFELDAHVGRLNDIQMEALRVNELLYSEKFDVVVSQFDSAQQQAILRARNGKTSCWLTVLLRAKSHFNLSPQEFWDMLGNQVQGVSKKYSRSVQWVWCRVQPLTRTIMSKRWTGDPTAQQCQRFT